jgi:hypothetical protein
MSSYIRVEALLVLDHGARLFWVAFDKSACPYHWRFFRRVIEPATRAVTTLGELTELGRPSPEKVLAALQLPAASAGDLLAWFEEEESYLEALGVEHGDLRLTPFAVASAAEGARVAVALPNPEGRNNLVRVLAVDPPRIVAELEVDRVHDLALSGDGGVLALLGWEELRFVDVATGAPLGPPLPYGRQPGVAARVAWAGERWVVTHRREGRSVLTALSPRALLPEVEVPLAGTAHGLAAASAAPVVACGVGRTTVQVVDFSDPAAPAVSTFEPHRAAPRFSRVEVAISADGAQVVSHGTQDHALFALLRGEAEARPLFSLPHATSPLPQLRTGERAVPQQLYTTPAFQLARAGLVTVQEDRWFLHPPLPPPVGPRWGGAPSSSEIAADGSPALEDMSVAALLAELVRWTAPAEADLVGALRDGASEDALAEAERWLGAPLPEELRALYAAHDGTAPEAALLAGAWWLPLEEARAHHAQLAAEQQQEGLEVLRRSDFPLLVAGGAAFVMRCGRGRSGPILHLRAGEAVRAYDGVRPLLRALVDAFRSGAARVEAGELVQDDAAMAAVKLRHNPGRARSGLGRASSP